MQVQEFPIFCTNSFDCSIVDRIDLYSISDKYRKIANINEQCSICLEEFCDGAMVRRLQCFHLFHNECIEDWFLSISLKCPDCPICRTLLNVNSLKMFGLCTNTDEMESKSFCSFDSYQSARARSVRAAEPALAQAQAPTQAPARVPARAPTNAVRSPIMTRSRSRILEQARNRRTRSNHRRANSINII